MARRCRAGAGQNEPGRTTITYHGGRFTMSGRPLRIALLGCGVVGVEVARLLTEQADDLAARVGVPLELAGIAVRRLNRKRDIDLDPALFTTDAAALVARDDIDIVLEVIGGIEPARSLLLTAMSHGASIVTANKALLAEDGATLYDAAGKHGVDLYFEASVAGAIPLLRPLRESLAGDTVHRVLGIVNGTTNFILTRMDETGAGFAEALDEATALGYAEADPSADIDAFDAAAKAAILAGLAFHTRVSIGDVHREGIGDVSATAVASAREMGCVVKLLAICERTLDGRGVSVRVHPHADATTVEGALADRKQLHDAAHLAGTGNRGRADIADAFTVDVGNRDARVKRKSGKDRCLRRRVERIDVGARISLRVTERGRLVERFGKASAGF